jgi:purine-binding chemotaxis protein CheW
MVMTQRDESVNEQFTEYVTVIIGNQLFGLPIARVQDVFVPERLTRVPLSPPEVAGVLNLRGRIVTAIDMRCRLDLDKRADGQPVMAIGIDLRGESYGLLVDAVGEVLKFPSSACEAKPANLDVRWARVASGVIRLEGQLLVVLDVDRVLDMKNRAVAA